MKRTEGKYRIFPRPGSTFGQLIVSCFVAFMIPFLFLCLALFSLVGHYLTQETVNAHALWATSVLYDIRQVESAMTDIQGQLQYDGSLESKYSPDQYTPAHNLIHLLYSLKSSSRYIRTVWYAASQDGFLFSDTGSLSLEMLLCWRYPETGLTAEAFSEEVLASGSIVILRSTDTVYGDKVILFSFPVLRILGANQTTSPVRHHVLFAIPEALIASPLREVNLNHDTSSECYYHGMPVCATAGAFPEETAYEGREPDCRVVSLHNMTVDVYLTAAESTFIVRSGGWTLVTHVQNLFAARKRAILWMTAMALLLLTAGCCISLRIARHVYSPIAYLRRQTAELSEAGEDAPPGNDFQTINQHLLSLSAKREELTEQLSANTDVIEGFLTYSLLGGHFESLSAFNATASPLQLPLRQANMRVLLLLTAGDPRMERALLRGAFPDEKHCSFLCAASAVEGGVVVMSESGLSNYYKKHFGQSILDSVTQLRIEQAITLLKNSKLSVQEISALVGYANVNSFIRRFKQIMNLTPGEYRRDLSQRRNAPPAE